MQLVARVFEVPDVIGETVNDAESSARENDLEISVSLIDPNGNPVTNPIAAFGRAVGRSVVVSQDPAPGSFAGRRSRVSVVGQLIEVPEVLYTEVPDVLGIRVSEAREVLEALGLGLEVLIDENGSFVPIDEDEERTHSGIAQSPTAGRFSPPGSTIRLFVRRINGISE